MATLINVLDIFVICLIGFGVYCLLAVPLWACTGGRLLSKRKTPGRFVIGLLAVPISYFVLLYTTYSWATRPAAIFEMAFGFDPPAEVEFHSSDHYILGDYGEQSLGFSASPDTVDRILQARFDTALAASQAGPDGSFSFSREFSDSFATETARLRYSPDTRSTRYHWIGID